MPRVLQVLEATVGGTRRHLRELSLGLLQAGWQVDVAYALGRDPGFAQDLELFRRHGVGLHEVPMLRGPAPVEDWRAVARLRSLLRQLHPDLAHAHSSKAGMLTRLAARQAGVPVVYTPHHFACEMRVSAPLRALYRALERRAAPWCARLIAVSQAEAVAARRLGYPPAKIATIPNGIPPAVAPDGEPTEARFDIAFAGRFCRQKGVDLLLAVLPSLRLRRPGLRVALMGDGDTRLCRRARRMPGVTLLPAGDQAAVLELLRASRIFALPSRWEGLPYALLEAMQAGVPVVAAAVGGVGDVVTHGRDALLVPPDDPAALAAALEALLNDTALRARLAGAAMQRVREFSLDRMLRATRREYAEAMVQTSARTKETEP